MSDIRTAALESKAWPYEEARKLLKRYPEGKLNAPVIFECGYGPSGLPHIGTFNEVLRTTMVRNAFRTLSDAPTRLIEFSDDMDGLRKVPDNVPNAAMLTEHLGKPLSRIPDPFEKFESFAAHNNAMLRDFLDRFGFDYEFISSSSQYEAGHFDDALRGILRNYDAIMGVMIPTLRKERAATYSPILPISAKTGIVLQVPVEVVDAEAGLIRFDDGGDMVTQSALGGAAKLQWKVDWAMRWVALGVDYEMYGKDLIDSGQQSGKIARILGGRPPEGFVYEMFLDELGQKISKSKGNGLTLEQWLDYGTQESLSFFAYREPKKAKALHIGVIPRAVDEYFQFRRSYFEQMIDQRLGNPVHHIHNGNVSPDLPPVTFGLLINLAGVLGPFTTKDELWNYLAVYIQKKENSVPYDELSDDFGSELNILVERAIAYNAEFGAHSQVLRKPAGIEVAALERLDRELATLPENVDGVAIQDIVYAIGNEAGFEKLRDWFQALYETLLGSSQGPRMGSFIALYGVENTRKLISEALA